MGEKLGDAVSLDVFFGPSNPSQAADQVFQTFAVEEKIVASLKNCF